MRIIIKPPGSTFQFALAAWVKDVVSIISTKSHEVQLP